MGGPAHIAFIKRSRGANAWRDPGELDDPCQEVVSVLAANRAQSESAF